MHFIEIMKMNEIDTKKPATLLQRAFNKVIIVNNNNLVYKNYPLR